jgi:hypothetical protein
MMTRHYQITIQEYLDESWSAHFDGLTITHSPDGATTLAGAVRDQAALYGLLAKRRDLGLTLLSVAPDTGAPPTETATGAGATSAPTQETL